MRPLIAALLLLLIASPAVSAPSTSVGVINSERVLFESNRGKALIKSLESRIQQKKQTLDAMQAEIVKIESDLSTRTLEQETRDKFLSELQEKRIAMKRQFEELQRESASERGKRLRQFALDVDPLIKEVAKREGIELVLDAAMGRGVIFVDESIDITEKVIELYDEQR
jgi:outer membrane protein